MSTNKDLATGALLLGTAVVGIGLLCFGALAFLWFGQDSGSALYVGSGAALLLFVVLVTVHLGVRATEREP